MYGWKRDGTLLLYACNYNQNTLSCAEKSASPAQCFRVDLGGDVSKGFMCSQKAPLSLFPDKSKTMFLPVALPDKHHLGTETIFAPRPL